MSFLNTLLGRLKGDAGVFQKIPVNSQIFAFSPDGRIFAAYAAVPTEGITNAARINLFDVATGKQVDVLADIPSISDRQHERGVGLTYSPDGRFLVACGTMNNAGTWIMHALELRG